MIARPRTPPFPTRAGPNRRSESALTAPWQVSTAVPRPLSRLPRPSYMAIPWVRPRPSTRPIRQRRSHRRRQPWGCRRSTHAHRSISPTALRAVAALPPHPAHPGAQLALTLSPPFSPPSAPAT